MLILPRKVTKAEIRSNNACVLNVQLMSRDMDTMTKQLQKVYPAIAAAAVLIYFLGLLNIDLASDAQASLGYLFYGPLGLIPSFFTYAFFQMSFST
jgi:hypothetical protein